MPDIEPVLLEFESDVCWVENGVGREGDLPEGGSGIVNVEEVGGSCCTDKSVDEDFGGLRRYFGCRHGIISC